MSKPFSCASGAGEQYTPKLTRGQWCYGLAHQEGEQEDVLRMDELRMTGTVERADKHNQMDQLETNTLIHRI